MWTAKQIRLAKEGRGIRRLIMTGSLPKDYMEMHTTKKRMRCILIFNAMHWKCIKN
jgi:hypothetical protein